MPSPPLFLQGHSEEATPQVYEWHEAHNVPIDHDALVLDGMGGVSSSTEQHTSFLGLSSGATFLRAIRRISGTDILACSPGQAGMLSFASFFEGMSGGRMPSSASELHKRRMRMPPLVEVLPYVDSFFRHFRE